MAIVRASILGLAIFAATAAQTFEAASVKHNTSGRNPGSTSRSGGQLVFRNTSLRESIAIAYGISPDRDYALSGPAWIGIERYDIVAKVAAEVPKEQVLRMLQQLLAERFELRVHREARQMRVYRLTLAHRSPNLKAVQARESNFTFGPGHIAAMATSMAELADKLSRPYFALGAPVLNATNLDGCFDFTLDWTPDSVPPDAAPGPSLLTALQERLGLKLEPSKGSVEVLTVDHANREPTAN